MAARKGLTAALTVGLVAGMLGLVAGAVPLYRMFCAATGYGGTPKVASAAPLEQGERMVTVRFDGSVAKGLPWQFRPAAREMRLRLGEQGLAWFTATNTGDRPLVGTATYNVTPDKAGRYFDKIQCFCFSQQRLEPGQTVEMPVTFFVDPALATDPHTEEVRTITLSYTFFRAPEQTSEARP